MKDDLEGRQCPNCDTWFTIVKTDSQKLCYDCDMEDQPTGEEQY